MINFGQCFKSSFKTHKFLFLFVLILVVFSLSFSCWLYDLDDAQKVNDDAYLAQESPYDFNDFLEIVTWNCYVNLQSYVCSIFLAVPAIIDLFTQFGRQAEISMATMHLTGDPLYFVKLTLVHGFFEDVSTILNTFASLILAYFEVAFIYYIIRPADNAANRFKASWDLNKHHLIQSLAVFFVALIVMVIAGVCEEYISVPIGNFLVEII